MKDTKLNHRYLLCESTVRNAQFFITYTNVSETSVEFKVEKLTVHRNVDIMNPGGFIGRSLYFKAELKWDGCTNVSLDEKNCIHFCGKRMYDEFLEVMKLAWEHAKERIKSYNEKIAET